MSKQSDAKEKQGFIQKPTLKSCNGCKHFKMDIEFSKATFRIYKKERNLRCGIGGFKVGKTSYCNMYEAATHFA